MGNHFREREGFCLIGRRAVLKGMVAGGALAMPAVVETKTQSDDERLEACIAEIRDILARMHPICGDVGHRLQRADDGTFLFTLNGRRDYLAYSGEGLYEVADFTGAIAQFWLRQDCERRVSDGTPVIGSEFFYAQQWEDGAPVDDWRRLYSRRLIRKLASGEPSIA